MTYESKEEKQKREKRLKLIRDFPKVVEKIFGKHGEGFDTDYILQAFNPWLTEMKEASA